MKIRTFLILLQSSKFVPLPILSILLTHYFWHCWSLQYAECIMSYTCILFKPSVGLSCLRFPWAHCNWSRRVLEHVTQSSRVQFLVTYCSILIRGAITCSLIYCYNQTQNLTFILFYVHKDLFLKKKERLNITECSHLPSWGLDIW